MSTTASPVSPFVVPHTITTGSNGSKSAMEASAARTEHQNALVMVSRGKVGGGGGGGKKNIKNKKNSKKYSRKSAMKKRFSQRFRRSVLRRKSRKMLHKKNKKSLHGGAGATANGEKLTIPSFRQTSPTGTGIISQLAGNHAQTLAYSAYDDQVSKPVS